MQIGLSPGITTTEELRERFTDRRPEIQMFIEALHWQSDTPARPLGFVGEGGKGKTTLCKYLAYHVCQPAGVPYGIADFDRPLPPEPHEVLLDLRQELFAAGVKFDCFDCVWTRFRQVTGIGGDRELSLVNVPVRMFQALVMGDFGALVSIVTEDLPNAAHWLRRQFGDSWDKRLKNMRRDEIVRVMPEAFAEDVERAMQRKDFRGTDGSKRIALFFDGIDRAVDDYVVVRLCQLLNSPLVVICGRRVSEWLESALKDKGLLRYLSNFSEEDAIAYLERRGITDSNIARRLFSVTNGFPDFLAKCAAECSLYMQRHGCLPGPAHFTGDVLDKVVERMVRDLSGDALDAIQRASIPRWFTEEILRELISDGPRARRLFRAITPFELCRPQSTPAGAYTVIQNARRLLRAQVRNLPEWQQWNRSLFLYHASKAQSSEQQAFAHKVEMVYHALVLNRDDAIALLDEVFQECLTNHYLARCNSLIEAMDEWAREVATQFAEEDRVWSGETVGRLALCKAELRAAEGQWEEAYYLAVSAIENLADAPTPVLSRAWTTLCHAGLRYEQEEKVLESIERALHSKRVLDDTTFQATLLRLLSEVHIHNLDWQSASMRLDEAAQRFGEAGRPDERCETLLVAARNALSAGEGKRAWELIREASLEATKLRSASLQVKALLAKTYFAEIWHDWHGGLWACQQALRMLNAPEQSLLKAEVLLRYAHLIGERSKDALHWGPQPVSERRLRKQPLEPTPSPIDCCQEAIKIYSAEERPALEAQARREFAIHLWDKGESCEAKQEAEKAKEIFQFLGARIDLQETEDLIRKWSEAPQREN